MRRRDKMENIKKQKIECRREKERKLKKSHGLEIWSDRDIKPGLGENKHSVLNHNRTFLFVLFFSALS